MNRTMHISPPCWWAGMADPCLEILIEAPGAGGWSVQMEPFQGVRLVGAVSPGGKDALIVTLHISRSASPGELHLLLTSPDGDSRQLRYPLLGRERRHECRSFGPEDVVYLVMPDRYCRAVRSCDEGAGLLCHPTVPDRSDPDARHGGNLAGLRSRLPYIADLGVTAVWCTPVFTNDMPGGSYHGYAITDHYAIDPRLGALDEWTGLVEEAHALGLKVIIDMVLNHVGKCHRWLASPPSSGWVNYPEGRDSTNYRLSTLHDPYATDYDRRHTVEGWFVESMPDLNLRDAHLLRFFVQHSIWWVERTGVDGIRVDTFPYADSDASGEWVRCVRRQYPWLNIVGECWCGSEAGTAIWQKGSGICPLGSPELPAVMDFAFADALHRALTETTGTYGGYNAVYEHLALDFLFPDPSNLLIFADNHDTDRLLRAAPADTLLWRQAMGLLLTTRGIPQIYYGTELLMYGTKFNGDGQIRIDMPGGFPGDRINAFDRNGRTVMQEEAHAFLRKLLHWRRGCRAVLRGTLRHCLPDKGFYLYQRRLGRECVTVILNGTDRALRASLAPAAELIPSGTRCREVVSGTRRTVGSRITLPPRALLILEHQAKQ